MPSYYYQCESCEQVDDHLHGMSESPRFACSACGGLTRKLPGKPNILSSEPVAESSTDARQDDHAGSACVFHQHHQHGPDCGHSH